jgi:hypothetical protein
MKTPIKLFGFLFLFHITLFVALAQADCVLGVGLSEDTLLIDVFQMNSYQKERLINFSAEVKYRNELLTTKLDNIRKRHPQSNVMELSQLAEKYKEVMDSMVIVQAMVDKRMLALFNEKQYELYQALCKEASRSPYVIVPMVYGDSIVKSKN